ncbi:class I SAM-dependent methyltransferase [Aquimarina algiphila]|uniref:class I SAM-dependent methyltransferase n=1 Tax=Aquimarina algiphila TaxID=2047982 RepID=UPI002490A702|nr:class I SAM-dependent methyltransferase [Aquimarina algiphila]
MDKTKIAIEVFDKFAKVYQDKYMDLAMYHDTFDLFCESIEKKNTEVLEVGCGPGNITKYMLQKRPDFKLLATDVSSKMIELAKINNPTTQIEMLDCRKITTLTQKYDAIISGFCLPYLSKEDALQFIQDVSVVLKPNGIFYVSTMEDDYSKSGFTQPSSGGKQEIYIHYHEAGYLIEALTGNGFTIMDKRRKTHPQYKDTTTKDLIIIAKKG